MAQGGENYILDLGSQRMNMFKYLLMLLKPPSDIQCTCCSEQGFHVVYIKTRNELISYCCCFCSSSRSNISRSRFSPKPVR